MDFDCERERLDIGEILLVIGLMALVVLIVEACGMVDCVRHMLRRIVPIRGTDSAA